MAKAVADFELPERLRVMRAFYTVVVIEAAMRRLILGESLPDVFTTGEKKAALILVRTLNPDEVLKESEECILRGVSDKTLRGMKQRRELPVVCGGVNTVSSES